MSRGEENKLVCVTGASGYIASWLVKLLLHRGYTVNGTVRSLDNPAKTEHLLALEGAAERLHLFEADLLVEGSFDSVVDGCIGVFHTASPVIFEPTDPQVEVIDPAVKGTINVLKSCKKDSALKRVIITSSMASVNRNRRPLTSDVIIDETWFSDPTFCEENKLWYPLSKTLAEEAAYKFAQENGIDLVTLHPSIVIGPLLQPTLNLTSEMILDFIKKGKEVDRNEIYRYVDVRDVANAHISAFEISSASGRYCLVGIVTCSSDTWKILGNLFPTLDLLIKNDNETPAVPLYRVSKERAKTLGIDFLPFEFSLRDIVESLKDKKFLSF